MSCPALGELGVGAVVLVGDVMFWPERGPGAAGGRRALRGRPRSAMESRTRRSPPHGSRSRSSTVCAGVDFMYTIGSSPAQLRIEAVLERSAVTSPSGFTEPRNHYPSHPLKAYLVTTWETESIRARRFDG